MLVVWAGAFSGALVFTAIVAAIVHKARKGADGLVGSVFYAGWVSLALYGVGARDEYDIRSAALYVASTALLAVAARLYGARKQRSAP